jgi:hypothetical protein
VSGKFTEIVDIGRTGLAAWPVNLQSAFRPALF